MLTDLMSPCTALRSWMYLRPLATPLIYTGMSVYRFIDLRGTTYERKPLRFRVRLHELQDSSIIAPRKDQSRHRIRQGMVPRKAVQPDYIVVVEGVP